jgi:hypothetical protein
MRRERGEAMKPKTIRVRIQAEQRVRYDQEVNMEVDDFKAYKKALKTLTRENERTIAGLAEGYLDLHDVSDWDDVEEAEITEVLP